MKKLQIIAVLLLMNICLFAQSTTLTLSTWDYTNSFHVNNTNTTSLFKVTLNGQVGVYQSSPRAQLEVGGIEGLLVTGTYNSGTALSLGAGVRLHWYPRKGAFRAGAAETSYWDDANIGVYSIAMGYQPRATGALSVAIGGYNYATGVGSLVLGRYCTASGINSIAIGYGITASGPYSMALGNGANTNGMDGAVVIGDNTILQTAYASNDNQLTMRFAGGYKFYTNSECTIGATISGNGNSWGTISDSTKKENIAIADGEYFLNNLSKLRLGSWNYKTQDAKQFRHYGPMAQEIFLYFGKDEYGTIGNDTTLATADMDGIMMICLQALEKRTEELKMEFAVSEGKWKTENVEMKKENEEMKNEITELKKGFEEMKSLVAGLKKESSIKLVEK